MEEIDITIGTGRDKIESIDEMGDTVILNYQASGQTRPITIPRMIINYVKEVIDEMEVGELYKSTYVYNKCIAKFNIKSNILLERMNIIKSILNEHNLEPFTIRNILNELEEHPLFLKMTFKELIGTREMKTSWYFKIYGAIRYWAEKGVIHYNQRGSIVRVV